MVPVESGANLKRSLESIVFFIVTGQILGQTTNEGQWTLLPVYLKMILKKIKVLMSACFSFRCPVTEQVVVQLELSTIQRHVGIRVGD